MSVNADALVLAVLRGDLQGLSKALRAIMSIRLRHRHQVSAERLQRLTLDACDGIAYRFGTHADGLAATAIAATCSAALSALHLASDAEEQGNEESVDTMLRAASRNVAAVIDFVVALEAKAQQSPSSAVTQ